MRNLSSEKPEEKNLTEIPEEDKELENREKIEIKINTVADMIDSLKWSYDLTENEEIKKQLAYQIIKIEAALNTAGLPANEVYVEETPEGVLGLYYPKEDKKVAAKDLLEDFDSTQQLITHVIYHEMTHSKGYADEGITEIKVNKELPAMMRFYVTEQQKAKSVFYDLGIDKTLDLYEIDSPEELIDYYLEVELEKKLKSTTKKLKPEEEAKKLSDELKQGVERLYERLEQKHGKSYIKTRVKEILEELDEKK